MASDAVKMNEELLDLVSGRVPNTREWKTEISLAQALPKGSRNKFIICNACEAIFARKRGDQKTVKSVLAWVKWLATTPLSAGEDLTGEEVYRAMQAYGLFVIGAVAMLEGDAEAERAALGMARAHVAWLAIGSGAGPGRKVRDHHIDKVGKPVVLIGDGEIASILQYACAPGPRGWIRNRDGGPQTFHFTESIGLSVMVAQAAGYAVPRKPTPWQVDLFKAIQAMAPGVDPFGFSEDEQRALRTYLGAPSSLANVHPIVGFVAAHAPSLPFVYIRYADGSVVAYVEHCGASSTDARMIDCWLTGGRTIKASADDGLRASSSPQKAWESETHVLCQFETGGEIVGVPKPTGPEAYRVRARGGVVTLATDSRNPPIPPPTEPGDTPNPPKPPRRRRWWEFWK